MCDILFGEAQRDTPRKVAAGTSWVVGSVVGAVAGIATGFLVVGNFDHKWLQFPGHLVRVSPVCEQYHLFTGFWTVSRVRILRLAHSAAGGAVFPAAVLGLNYAGKRCLSDDVNSNCWTPMNRGLQMGFLATFGILAAGYFRNAWKVGDWFATESQPGRFNGPVGMLTEGVGLAAALAIGSIHLWATRS